MVDFVVFSSLFRVLFVLPVGLARLDVFPFSFRRLECSCHPSQSTKGDFSICWAPGRRLSSAFRSVLLFFSLFGVFVDLLSGFSLRRVFSFFLVDWSSFPTPPNRKMWLLEPIGSLSAQVGVIFCFFERTASGSVWNKPSIKPETAGFMLGLFRDKTAASALNVLLNFAFLLLNRFSSKYITYESKMIPVLLHCVFFSAGTAGWMLPIWTAKGSQ